MTHRLSSDSVYFFSLSIAYARCEALYQPHHPAVVLTADSGHRVQIPASRLRAFIERSGIKGRFRMIVSAENKIKSFERIR
ncbi:DUF2835 domain-containing protein [Alteromonas pelagimontana]|uniref:DUF2835 domain-containing protein n=1 Tax=Alteromonas pelagimontana TaxID=1858656 RepID=A0A6M4MI61_9ALTE|nr:DUF2835 family protein [Alteromonas pelagimontana]QJR82608.1 DUF2835 domain-containing protein [Alteromonas pelagimontana]